MKNYLSSAGVLIVALALAAASPGVAQNTDSRIYVVDEQVYANLPLSPLTDLLVQLTEAADIDLSLSSDLEAEAELYAQGASLYRVVDHLIPDGCGYAFELDQARKIRRLIVFSDKQDNLQRISSTERQRYLARQIGKRDDGTADLMHETLSDRDLNDPQAKIIAIEQLADIDSDLANKRLHAGIGDPDPKVRLSTAKALYDLRGDEAITLIGQIYFAEESDSFRRDVASIVIDSTHPLAQGMVRRSGL